MNSPILAQPAALPTPAAVEGPAVTDAPPRRTATAAPPTKPAPPTPGPSLTGEALLLVVLVGFVAAGAASMLRKKWSTSGVFGAPAASSPTAFNLMLSCDTCISTWCSAVATAVWWYASKLPVVPVTAIFFGSIFLAGTALCLVLLKLVQALTKVATV